MCVCVNTKYVKKLNIQRIYFGRSFADVSVFITNVRAKYLMFNASTEKFIFFLFRTQECRKSSLKWNAINVGLYYAFLFFWFHYIALKMVVKTET